MLLTTPTEQHLVASSGVLLKFSQTTPRAFSMGFPQGKGEKKPRSTMEMERTTISLHKSETKIVLH